MQPEPKVNILMVDDHPENIYALEAILEGLGENLVRAYSGPEALRYLLHQDFAVIILDVQMPGMDGFETATLIRQREQSKQTPIIFLTAISQTSNLISQGYSVGAVDYLLKPIEPSILKWKVKVFVDLFKKTQQVERQAAQLQTVNKKLEEQLQKVEFLNQELQLANQELKAFSYSVCHDLRNPLTSVKSFSYLLSLKYSNVLDETAKHYLQCIQVGSNRMAELIDDLLRLYQITTSEMNRQLFNLSEFAATVIADLQNSQPERQVELIIAPDLVVEGDQGLLKIVLQNLLSNAWKYTGKQTLAKIELGVTQYDKQKVYFVRDNGAGFNMESATKLFNPFERLHTRSEFEGTGIGLTIVQRIIQRHGGTIWAEASVEQGATFYFTL
jgi:two-component system sensor histidine kinase/response regulator